MQTNDINLINQILNKANENPNNLETVFSQCSNSQMDMLQAVYYTGRDIETSGDICCPSLEEYIEYISGDGNNQYWNITTTKIDALINFLSKGLEHYIK